MRTLFKLNPFNILKFFFVISPELYLFFIISTLDISLIKFKNLLELFNFPSCFFIISSNLFLYFKKTYWNCSLTKKIGSFKSNLSLVILFIPSRISLSFTNLLLFCNDIPDSSSNSNKILSIKI